MQISTIGIDLAKNVFQVHGIDAAGKVIITKKLRRSQVLPLFEKLPPCLIGMEACATSHHWARELRALGHDVRLMPASYVKAYVKRNKNDAADAAAICEAVTRPSMRFVAIKTDEQQAVLMLHRTRDLLVRQRTQLINAMRAHLAELGLVAAQGREGLQALIAIVRDRTRSLPDLARTALEILLDQLAALRQQLGKIEHHIQAQHRSSDASRRLETIPGIGMIAATAIAASVPDARVFKSGTRVCGLDRAGAEAELDRRQRATGLDLQAGRPLLAPVARGWSDGGHKTRTRPSRKASVADPAAGATTGQGRCGSARQQDRAYRLGGACQGRDLSRAGACGERVMGCR